MLNATSSLWQCTPSLLWSGLYLFCLFLMHVNMFYFLHLDAGTLTQLAGLSAHHIQQRKSVFLPFLIRYEKKKKKHTMK